MILVSVLIFFIPSMYIYNIIVMLWHYIDWPAIYIYRMSAYSSINYGYFWQKFSVKETEVQNSLLCGDPHDQLRIAYYLIIDNKRIMDEGQW